MPRDDVVMSIGRYRGGPFHDAFIEDVEWTELVMLEQYDVDSDMLEIEDAFSIEVPFTTELRERLAPDNVVKLAINGVVVLVGFIDAVNRSRSKSGGSTLSIQGRDKGGRLVDESMPLGRIDGLGIKDLANLAASPWFPGVSLSNARNRRLFAGKSRNRLVVSSEPEIEKDRKANRKINPGDSRAQVIEGFCKKADLLCWSSADGEEFIVGKPNYEQPTSFRFIIADQGDVFDPAMMVTDFAYTESLADCYSEIVVVGESKGSGVNYHSNVTRRVGRSIEGDAADGTGRRFAFPKKLIVQDSDVRNAQEAQQRASREMNERLSTNLSLSITVPGHSQNGIVYHFDAMAIVNDRQAFDPYDFLITRVHFSGSKSSGQQTELTLVPKGTVLQMGGM